VDAGPTTDGDDEDGADDDGMLVDPELPDPDAPAPERTVITLGPGEARSIRYASSTSYWLDGRPVDSVAFLKALFGELGDLVEDEAELRKKWSNPDLRTALLDQLEERGFTGETLAEMAYVVDARDSDMFDILAFVKFSLEPQTRAQRSARVRRGTLAALPAEMRGFLRDVLDAYEANGVEELAKSNLRNLLHVRYHDTSQAIAALGPATIISQSFTDIQSALYAQ
jgi:type I restriction enzyme R subunit